MYYESIIRGKPTLTFSLENFGDYEYLQILNFDDLRKIVPLLLKDYKINQENKKLSVKFI